jgi:hypothetical protein
LACPGFNRFLAVAIAAIPGVYSRWGVLGVT